MASWIAMVGSAVIGSLLLMSFLRYSNDVTQDAYLNTLEHIAYESLSDATDVIENELSLIGVGINDPQVNPILSADSTEITFCWDRNGNGRVDTLRYHLSSTADASNTDNPNDRLLYRTFNGHTTFVAAIGLTDFKIRYFDTMGYETAALDEIRTIEFEISAESTINYNNRYPRVAWHGKVTPPNLYGK